MQIKTTRGFSLIELLTVIAIIAMLAAIIFPVMSAAREKANRSQCMTNLNQIATAMKLFKNDNNRYPPVLAGFAEPGRKLDSIQGYLFSEYVKSAKGFACPNNLITDMTITTPDPLAGEDIIGLDRPDKQQLYVYDSYDSQVLSVGQKAWPRYTLAWANQASEVSSANPAITNPRDIQLTFQRQLKFRNPPDDTVVTWCSYHRGGDRSPGRSGAMDIVLFLDGHTDLIQSNQFQPAGSPWNYPYTVKPKP